MGHTGAGAHDHAGPATMDASPTNAVDEAVADRSSGGPLVGSAMAQPVVIAALYVQTDGVYASIPDIDCWGVERDARTYAGTAPVIAHPPCQRWGRFAHGSPRKPFQFILGDDGGCFAAALGAVRRCGGVLEHPADSHAWVTHGLLAPPRAGGWHVADWHGGWTCYVEQGFYGHAARKGTWLYAHGVTLPSLRWGEGEQRLDPLMVERYGYEYARRKGMVSMIGGKRKTEIRNATPPDFAALLVSIARTAAPGRTGPVTTPGHTAIPTA